VARGRTDLGRHLFAARNGEVSADGVGLLHSSRCRCIEIVEHDAPISLICPTVKVDKVSIAAHGRGAVPDVV
jgi:hypothetical protein